MLNEHSVLYLNIQCWGVGGEEAPTVPINHLMEKMIFFVLRVTDFQDWCPSRVRLHKIQPIPRTVLPSKMSSLVNIPQVQAQGGLQRASQKETFHEPSFQTLSTLLASLNYSSFCNFQNTNGGPDGFCNLLLHLLKWLKRL